MQASHRLPHSSSSLLFHKIRNRAVPLKTDGDLKALTDEIARARIVMLGEASHGSHEFYEWRSKISEILVRDHGFTAICVEGDWPPCWELNQWLMGERGGSAYDVLRSFVRWPTWMWANDDVARLAQTLRDINDKRPHGTKVGFYGLDVYSLFESIDSVLETLQRVDPVLARKARERYACFEPFHRDERAYVRSLIRFPQGCADEVQKNLQDLLRLRLGNIDLEQNARIVANAESYYRSMMFADENSWNIRDQHMVETLEQVMKWHGSDSKVIIWAHNTHIGDYRATSMKEQGLVNMGGLAREKWGDDQVKLVGFGTYRGQVTASHAWDGPVEMMIIPPGRPGSIEDAFHEVARAMNQNSFYVSLAHSDMKEGALNQTHGHRAIGVVYNPEHERFGNYVPTLLADRYDAFVFVDRTTALRALAQQFVHEEIPDTWPQGF